MTNEALSAERLREILAATEGVTPGPWQVFETDTHNGRGSQTHVGPPPRSVAHITSWTSNDQGARETRAFHIANCDPQTVSALVSELIDKREAVDRLTQERDEARQIVRDIYWMALRYADGRMTYAVGMCNDAVQKGYDGGWLPAKSDGGDPITPRLARDGMSPEWRNIIVRAEAAEAQLAKMREALEAANDRGRRDMLNALLELNPKAAQKRHIINGGTEDTFTNHEGRLPFDVVFWVCEVADQLGIKSAEEMAEMDPPLGADHAPD